MKTIYLVRHGKAVTGEGESSDFDRVLAEKGKKESLQIAKRLKKQQIKSSLIISSPALRAFETAEIVAGQLKYPKKNIRTRQSLYDQTETALLDVVHEVDEEHDSIMIVGHNPSMNDFARFLINGFTENIPTGGVVGVACDTGTWKEIQQELGELTLFEVPLPGKEPGPKKTKKSMRKDLEKKLTGQIGNILNEIDQETTKKFKKSLKEYSRNIAKDFVKKLKLPVDRK